MESKMESNVQKPANQVACGVFVETSNAEAAVSSLVRAGFEGDHISVVMRGINEARNLAVDAEVRDAEAVGAGIGLGSVLGAAAGIMAGLGLLIIPGIGPLLAVGPIVAGITGALAGGAVGAIAESLITSGIHETEAQAIEEVVLEGGVLITVRCEGRCDEALAILTDHGAGRTTCTIGAPEI